LEKNAHLNKRASVTCLINAVTGKVKYWPEPYR
jgi:hypothetical protein